MEPKEEVGRISQEMPHPAPPGGGSPTRKESRMWAASLPGWESMFA